MVGIGRTRVLVLMVLMTLFLVRVSFVLSILRVRLVIIRILLILMRGVIIFLVLRICGKFVRRVKRLTRMVGARLLNGALVMSTM